MQFWKDIEFYSLSPRLNRVKYLCMFFFWLGTLLTICFLASLAKSSIANALILIAFVITVPNVLAIKIRRLHDIGLSSWWLLGLIIPWVNIFFSLLISFWPGDKGINKYGERPEPARKFYFLYILVLPIYLLLATFPAFYKLSHQ